MNVVRLNEYLSGNVKDIETILNALGCYEVKYNPSRNEFRCAKEMGSNPTAVSVNTDNLRYICFSSNSKGSIYNLVMSKLDIGFPQALKWVANTLDLERDMFSGEVKLPFDGFFRTLISSEKEPEMYMKTYPESILSEFDNKSNLMFLNDGISFDIQDKFNIGYDIESNRITIPQWNFNGELVGVMGRSNDPDIPHEYRWLPIIPCSRGYTLFGYHQNYRTIQEEQTCIITESEKGVMQLASMGINTGLATCTNCVSKVQERYIKALRVDTIILAYDEGVSERELMYEAQKLRVDNQIYRNKVGYIFDKYGDILKAGSKNSPTDMGKKNFEKMMKEYIKWV